jgi:hypothetical protein
MSTRFCQLVIALALGVLLCMPGMSNASWTSVQQGWYDNYPEGSNHPVAVDQLDFYIVSGSATFDTSTPLASFGSPGFSGWTVKSYSPTYVVATNPSAPTSATWDYIFSGSSPVANYNLVWYAYYKGQFQLRENDIVGNGSIDFGPSGDGIYVYTYTPPPDPTPLPPSALLLGSGILGLIALRWRRKGPA